MCRPITHTGVGFILPGCPAEIGGMHPPAEPEYWYGFLSAAWHNLLHIFLSADLAAADVRWRAPAAAPAAMFPLLAQRSGSGRRPCHSSRLILFSRKISHHHLHPQSLRRSPACTKNHPCSLIQDTPLALAISKLHGKSIHI